MRRLLALSLMVQLAGCGAHLHRAADEALATRAAQTVEVLDWDEAFAADRAGREALDERLGEVTADFAEARRDAELLDVLLEERDGESWSKFEERFVDLGACLLEWGRSRACRSVFDEAKRETARALLFDACQAERCEWVVAVVGLELARDELLLALRDYDRDRAERGLPAREASIAQCPSATRIASSLVGERRRIERACAGYRDALAKVAASLPASELRGAVEAAVDLLDQRDAYRRDLRSLVAELSALTWEPKRTRKELEQHIRRFEELQRRFLQPLTSARLGHFGDLALEGVLMIAREHRQSLLRALAYPVSRGIKRANREAAREAKSGEAEGAGEVGSLETARLEGEASETETESGGSTSETETGNSTSETETGGSSSLPPGTSTNPEQPEPEPTDPTGGPGPEPEDPEPEDPEPEDPEPEDPDPEDPRPEDPRPPPGPGTDAPPRVAEVVDPESAAQVDWERVGALGRELGPLFGSTWQELQQARSKAQRSELLFSAEIERIQIDAMQRRLDLANSRLLLELGSIEVQLRALVNMRATIQADWIPATRAPSPELQQLDASRIRREVAQVALEQAEREVADQLDKAASRRGKRKGKKGRADRAGNFEEIARAREREAEARRELDRADSAVHELLAKHGARLCVRSGSVLDTYQRDPACHDPIERLIAEHARQTAVVVPRIDELRRGVRLRSDEAALVREEAALHIRVTYIAAAVTAIERFHKSGLEAGDVAAIVGSVVGIGLGAAIAVGVFTP